MHESSPAAKIARSPDAWERLAKSWLVEVIERSPLSEVDHLPLGWIAREASLLIAEVLGQLSDPGAARDLALSPAALERIATLAATRDPEVLVTRLPRELSALQSLLIEALDRELPERDRREFTRAVSRLAEVFGVVQAAALRALSARSDGPAEPAPARNEPVPASVGPALHDADPVPPVTEQDPARYVGGLVADSRRTGLPFTLAHFEVEGVERISKGYGEDAAVRMVNAVAGVLDGQLGDGDRAFRVGMGRVLVVLDGDDQDGLDLAVHVANVIEGSQAARGPRVEVTVGVASFPRHATEPHELIQAAEEAAWAARASGETAALARSQVLQDP